MTLGLGGARTISEAGQENGPAKKRLVKRLDDLGYAVARIKPLAA